MGYDTVEAFFDDLHDFWRVIFKTIFMGPVMFLIVMTTMVSWHLRKSFPHAEIVQPMKKYLGRPSTHLRRVALNILILQLYFDPVMPSFVQSRKFSCAVIAVIFETIIMRHGSKWLAKWHLEKLQAERGEEVAPESNDMRRRLLSVGPMEEKDEDIDPRWDDDPDAEPGGDLTESMYMDLTVAFHSIVPIFIVQLCLMAFYMNELNDPSSDTKDQKNVEFGYWLVGVMIQLYAGEQQLGAAYNRKFWAELLFPDPDGPIARLSEMTQWIMHDKVPMTYHKIWMARSWMDFLINSVARDVIMYTFPIMLCVEGPLDFVKDCCAVFFITTLDDTGFEKAKTVPQMMVRLKFNIFFDHLRRNRGSDINIPLRFTEDEAESAKFDPNVWDQFENQRGYVSPYLPGGDTKLLDYMMDNIQPKDVPI